MATVEPIHIVATALVALATYGATPGSFAVIPSPSQSAEEEEPEQEDTTPPGIAVRGGESRMTVTNARRDQATTGKDEPTASVPDPFVYDRHGPCNLPDWTAGAVPVCAGSDVLPPAPDCGDDTLILPLWRRPAVDANNMRWTAGDPTAPWELVEPWHCPTDPVPVLTATAFAELPLAPAPAHIQPAVGDILINVPVILYTDPTEQTFTTTLLGQQINVRAVPDTYTWTFTDDTNPLITTDPGRPYPAKDLTHVYTTPGDYAITLTTTWTGTYQINGTGTWYPVAGTATTTTTTRTFTAHEARTHLVAAP